MPELLTLESIHNRIVSERLSGQRAELLQAKVAVHNALAKFYDARNDLYIQRFQRIHKMPSSFLQELEERKLENSAFAELMNGIGSKMENIITKGRDAKIYHDLKAKAFTNTLSQKEEEALLALDKSFNFESMDPQAYEALIKLNLLEERVQELEDFLEDFSDDISISFETIDQLDADIKNSISHVKGAITQRYQGLSHQLQELKDEEANEPVEQALLAMIDVGHKVEDMNKIKSLQMVDLQTARKNAKAHNLAEIAELPTAIEQSSQKEFAISSQLGLRAKARSIASSAEHNFKKTTHRVADKVKQAKGHTRDKIKHAFIRRINVMA